MKIRIPEGKLCNGCRFFGERTDYDYDDNDSSQEVCNLFNKDLHMENCETVKLPQCLKEFGNGGEFELIKKDKP